jgi:thiol-disulfide isomerase/thioredoxin
MSDSTEIDPSAKRRRLVRLVAGTGVVILVGAAGVLYGMRGLGKESAAAACPGAAALAARLDPLVHGEVAALNLLKTPGPLPAISFQDTGTASKTLADFKGKTILLNLWATWCVPCRKEMPALDRLQAKLGGPDFQVVALNVDTAKLDRPKQFFRDVGISALPFYADPDGRVFSTLRESGPVLGLPTTFLIDRNGCAVGTMAGPAEWDSADAEKVIQAAKS